jgi:hypothetical protein
MNVDDESFEPAAKRSMDEELPSGQPPLPRTHVSPMVIIQADAFGRGLATNLEIKDFDTEPSLYLPIADTESHLIADLSSIHPFLTFGTQIFGVEVHEHEGIDIMTSEDFDDASSRYRFKILQYGLVRSDEKY